MRGHRIGRAFAFVVWVSAAAWAAGQQLPPPPPPPPPPAAPVTAVRDAPRLSAVGTAIITGTIVSSDSSARPVRRVSVSLNAASTGPSAPRMATTDDQGRFAFAHLPAGNYSALYAVKPGYVRVAYGEKRPGGMGIPITLTEGQRLSVTMKLIKGGVITGAIVDDTGRPAENVQVMANQIRVVNGERQAAMSAASGYGYGFTDDRGIYRMFGLAPGDYLVAANPRNMAMGATGTAAELRPVTLEEVQWAQGQLAPRGVGAATAQAPVNQAPAAPARGQAITYSPVYYPGTVDAAAAQLVTVLPGQEMSGIDFRTQFVSTAKVEGTILYPDGQPVRAAQMNVVPKLAGTTTGIGSEFLFDAVFMNRPIVNAGKFTIAALKPGEYTISARAVPQDAAAAPQAPGGRGAPMPPPAASLWAMTDITVSGADQSGLVLRLEPGMTVSGKIAFEGTTLQPPADLSRVSLRLTGVPTPGAVSITVGAGTAQVAADGSFKLSGVTPGRYTLAATAPAATPVAGTTWQIRSALAGTLDVADNPLEIKPDQNVEGVTVIFTDKSAEVAGVLSDATGQPTSDFSVVLFSVNRTAWSQRGGRRFRQPVRAGADGKFRFFNLPAGEYYLAALTDFDPVDIGNPAFFDQIVPSAIKLTLEEGEKKTQDIKLAGGS
jgi:hypothetical protein